MCLWYTLVEYGVGARGFWIPVVGARGHLEATLDYLHRWATGCMKIEMRPVLTPFSPTLGAFNNGSVLPVWLVLVDVVFLRRPHEVLDVNFIHFRLRPFSSRRQQPATSFDRGSFLGWRCSHTGRHSWVFYQREALFLHMNHNSSQRPHCAARLTVQVPNPFSDCLNVARSLSCRSDVSQNLVPMRWSNPPAFYSVKGDSGW